MEPAAVSRQCHRHSLTGCIHRHSNGTSCGTPRSDHRRQFRSHALVVVCISRRQQSRKPSLKHTLPLHLDYLLLPPNTTMDNLARQHKHRYEEALDHALEGRKDSALDICWELRLEPRIGVYRRAMVNLLIAQLLTYDQMKYAEECLDLLDILQQNNNGEVSDNVKNIISIAEDLIEELEVERLQTADASGARKIVIDPTTGLLSDPPSSPPTKDQQDTASNAKGDKHAEMKDVVGKGSGKSVRSDKSGSGDNDTSMKSASGNSHSDHVSSQKGAGDNDRRVIYVYKTDKTEKDDVAADHNNTVTIEGMLRDSSHKPRVK
ncbi:hypothetical protein EDD36DRAFT_178194 [Exophiala viscosa]|uniref:Uncharacterized protein n=1 Tax=Exophiala viscosa TaxID=2486360 RepID=A0AAN6IFK2_9EURO|nr:hypothetical protein EDD36DRAFT_178194 [Exophiala viscosa]